MDNEIILRPQDAIVCPRGTGEGSPIVIDLKAILKAQARIIEVQAVTPVKAGELLSTFNISWRDLHQHIVFLEKELLDAERAVKRIRSRIILDEVPSMLKERGLPNNEHHRDAIVELDDRYNEAVDRKSQIEAIIELLKGMLKAMEMAYTSVKKLLGESAFNFLNRADFHGDDEKNPGQVGQVSRTERPAQVSPPFAGFGNPKY